MENNKNKTTCTENVNSDMSDVNCDELNLQGLNLGETTEEIVSIDMEVIPSTTHCGFCGELGVKYTGLELSLCDECKYKESPKDEEMVTTSVPITSNGLPSSQCPQDCVCSTCRKVIVINYDNETCEICETKFPKTGYKACDGCMDAAYDIYSRNCNIERKMHNQQELDYSSQLESDHDDDCYGCGLPGIGGLCSGCRHEC